jgi:hypothetical protein
MWEVVPGGFKHPVHGVALTSTEVEPAAATIVVDAAGETGSPVQLHCEELGDMAGDSVAENGSCGGFAAATFTSLWGPDRLPSEYLEELTATGLVTMPALLAPEKVAQLQALATAWEEPEYEGKPLVLRSSLGVKSSTHPVALWVIKSYLKTDGVKLAHSPGFSILPPDGGTGGTQGWSADCSPTMHGHSAYAASPLADFQRGVLVRAQQALRLPVPSWQGQLVPGNVRLLPDRDSVWTAVQHLHHRFQPREWRYLLQARLAGPQPWPGT